jgi:hypothetical protein
MAALAVPNPGPPPPVAACSLPEKLAAEERRRVVLVRERDTLDASAKMIDLTSAKVFRAIRQPADDIAGALLTHRAEAADVLRAFVSRIDCTPFGSGRGRGYPFKGLGGYRAIFGETFPTTGVPDGTRLLRTFGSRVSPPWRLCQAEIPRAARMARYVRYLARVDTTGASYCVEFVFQP